MQNEIMQPTRDLPYCLGLPKGAPLESVCGTVGFVGSRYVGEGQYGPYSMQTIGISDGENQTLVVLANREPLSQDYRSCDLWFSSWQNEKGELIGVKMGTSKDKDKNVVQAIMVGKAAVIMDADGNDPAPRAVFESKSTNAPKPPPRPATPAPAGNAPARPAAPTRPATPSATPGTRMTAGGIARKDYQSLDHLMKVQMDGIARALDCVAHIEAHKWVKLFGEPMNNEDRRSMAIVILIEANRSGAIWGDCKNRFSEQRDPNVEQAAPTPPPTNGGGEPEAPEDWQPEQPED